MSRDEEAFTELRRRTPAPRPGTQAVVVVASLVTVAAVVVFAMSVVAGWATEVQLAAIGVAVLAFLVGLRRYFAQTYPQVEAAEPRPDLADEVEEELPEIMPLSRRRLLTRVLVGAAAALGLSVLAPIASLGPRYRPPESGWATGTRLVTERGDPIRPDDLPAGSIAVVWPEDGVREEHGAVMLVRLVVEPQPPTRLDWVVDSGIVAYSRVCTHAGCAIGIFREGDSALYCPCHQAQFDAGRGATPIFGPASRPLPQLPLGVGPDGHLVALGDFTEPVGPPRG